MENLTIPSSFEKQIFVILKPVSKRTDRPSPLNKKRKVTSSNEQLLKLLIEFSYAIWFSSTNLTNASATWLRRRSRLEETFCKTSLFEECIENDKKTGSDFFTNIARNRLQSQMEPIDKRTQKVKDLRYVDFDMSADAELEYLLPATIAFHEVQARIGIKILFHRDQGVVARVE